MAKLCKKCGKIHAGAATGMDLSMANQPSKPPVKSSFARLFNGPRTGVPTLFAPSAPAAAPPFARRVPAAAPPANRRQPAAAPPAPRLAPASTLVPPSDDSASGIWTVQILLSDVVPIQISGLVPATDSSMPMDSKLFVTGIYITPGQYLFNKPSNPLRASSIGLIKLKGDTLVPAGVPLSIEVKNTGSDTRGQLFLVNVVGSGGQIIAPVATRIVDLSAAPGFGSDNFRS